MYSTTPKISPDDAVGVYVPSIDSDRRAAHISHGRSENALCGTQVEGSRHYDYHAPYAAEEIAEVEKGKSWFSGSKAGKTLYGVQVCQECDSKLREYLTEEVAVEDFGDA